MLANSTNFSIHVADAFRLDPVRGPHKAQPIGIPGGLTTMLRQRFRASVALLTAAFVVSNLGCSTGAFRQALSPDVSSAPHSVSLPSEANTGVETAAYDVQRLPATESRDSGVAVAQYNAPYTTAADYDNVDLDVDQVVRGQGFYNGPLKETLINPYVIGAAILAGIIIPLAVDNRDTPVGGP